MVTYLSTKFFMKISSHMSKLAYNIKISAVWRLNYDDGVEGLVWPEPFVGSRESRWRWYRGTNLRLSPEWCWEYIIEIPTLTTVQDSADQPVSKKLYHPDTDTELKNRMSIAVIVKAISGFRLESKCISEPDPNFFCINFTITFFLISDGKGSRFFLKWPGH